MVDTSLGLICGGYTHELIYISGPVFDSGLAPINADLSPYTLNELSGTEIDMTGTLDTFAWLGTHKFIIKATNGKFDSNPTARGDQGLFKSVQSAQFTLTIINPCLTTVVNGDKVLEIEEIAVPPGKTLTELILAGPTDSASALYGNGYDKCGDLTYLWLKGGEEFMSEWFSMNATVTIADVDEMNLALRSEPRGTTLYD